MSKLLRARRAVPAACVVAASAVALAASPASAVTINEINVSSARVPSGAVCAHVSTNTGNVWADLPVRPGSTFQLRGFTVQTGERVSFQWYSRTNSPGGSCASNSHIRGDHYIAPNRTPWNIN
ncbi:hypothetical protein ABZ078_15195 [Streptomyces sp. NPDC006385]|uniref:hypothetical protein n=1 Tax=Streptomyces sp. NPDC006385 TaxID=3156761 RepID=UPI0033B5BC3A